MELIRGALRRQADTVAKRLAGKGVRARTVTLKIKYADFTAVTRRVTHDDYFRSADIIYDQGGQLLKKTEAGGRPVRLVGLGVSQFWKDDEAAQLSLFDFAGLDSENPDE